MFKLLEGTTDQKTFDKVVTALRKQGKPAFNDRSCMYLTPDGCKCAIGHLFPKNASPEAFKVSGSALSLKNMGLISNPRNMDLLLDLQKAHDRPVLNKGVAPESPINWAIDCSARMINVAKGYGLNPAKAEAWSESLKNP